MSERAVIIVVSACTFASVLNTTMFNVVLPEIGREFDASPASLGWLFTAYALVFGIATPFYGRLGDIYGLRRFLMIGIAIFSLGSLAASMAPDYSTLLGARIVQAIGAGAIPPLGTAILFRVVPAQRRGLAMGYMSAVIATSAGLGPVIGGALAEFVSWRALFLIGALLFLLIPVQLRVLPSLAGSGKGSVDILGGLMLGTMMAGGLLSLTYVERTGVQSPQVLIPLAFALTAFALLFQRVRTRPDAFVPRDLLQNRNYVLLGGTALGMMMTAMGSFVTMPLLLDRVQNIPVGQIGLVMLPSAVVSAVLGPVAGRMADRAGSTLPLRLGLLSLFSGVVLLSSFGVSGSAWTVSAIGILIGAGMGLASSPLLNSVSLILPSTRAGTAIGLIHMVFLIGGSLGVTMMTTVIDSREGITNAINVLHSGAGAAFSDTFLIACVASGTALFFATRLRVPHPSQQPSAVAAATASERPQVHRP
jgi:MFS transporter, DHA2 family, metal-tetracycline-proton antiporter